MPQSNPNSYWRQAVKGHTFEEKVQIIARGILFVLNHHPYPISRGRLAQYMGYNSGTGYNSPRSSSAFVVLAIENLEKLGRIAFENKRILITEKGRAFLKDFANKLPDADALRKFAATDYGAFIRKEIPSGTGIPKTPGPVRPITLAQRIENLIRLSIGELNPEDALQLSTDSLNIRIWVKTPSIKKNSSDGSTDSPAGSAEEITPSTSTTSSDEREGIGATGTHTHQS